jgi:hypothetical protein
MKKGYAWNIDLHLSFKSKIIIALVESDSLLGDKDLGVTTINSSFLTKKVSFSNRGNSCNYELSYCQTPFYSVELANLECINNNDIKGSISKLYFKYKLDNGEELRYPTCGNHIVQQGESCYIGLNLQFTERAFISLIDSSSQSDKNLGVIQLNGTIFDGYQHFCNDNEDWDYKIIYFRLNRVTAQKKQTEKHEFALQ